MKITRSIILIPFAFIVLYGCIKEKVEPTPVVHETGTMTDIEGNVYKTVKIGNQWWMSENLKVHSYRNGHSITGITNNDDWQNATNGAYCNYDPINVNSPRPGFLYNWLAVSDTNNIAPAGWHIPSDEEWKELEMGLGMSISDAGKSGWRGTHEGEKLKIEGTQGWTTYEGVWATNESGFTARAGSCRIYDGAWGLPGLFATGFWWTRTSSDTLACYRYLDYKNANVFRGFCAKNYGYSIRCVKD